MPNKNGDALLEVNSPNPIDSYVGSRIRLRRTVCSLSQQRLGSALGLTFQQVQKYERGTNRVCASRLFAIARVLTVHIDYFFDDMPAGLAETPIAGPRGRVSSNTKWHEQPTDAIDPNFGNAETLDLVSAFYRISDRAVRRRMISLLKSLAP